MTGCTTSPTLITGLSGTGKELVARAIGLTRYVPFDPEREAFAGTLDGAFHTLNLSALSPTLIESELDGEVMACIDRDLGPDYPWPGNVRELE